MSWNRDDPDAVGHHDVFPLPGNPKPRLLQNAYGVLMVDARNPWHGLWRDFDLADDSTLKKLSLIHI